MIQDIKIKIIQDIKIQMIQGIKIQMIQNNNLKNLKRVIPRSTIISYITPPTNYKNPKTNLPVFPSKAHNFKETLTILKTYPNNINKKTIKNNFNLQNISQMIF